MVDVQRTAQLAYAAAAAAAAAVKSERVCWSGHKPAIRRTQAAGQHEVGWLQGLSHGCSEIAILLRLRCQATTAGRDITASQPSERIAFSDDCLGTLSPACSRKQAAAAQAAKSKDGYSATIHKYRKCSFSRVDAW